MTDRRGRSGPREVEIELDLPRMLLLAVLAVVALTAAFWAGRATAPAASAATGALGRSSAGAPVETSDVTEGETLFDREGAGGAEREPARQVTREDSRAGRFEVEVGTAPTRREAEALRERVRAAGLPALVVRGAEGRYRVSAGPFRTRDEAARAAARLERALGRRFRVAGGS